MKVRPHLLSIACLVAAASAVAQPVISASAPAAGASMAGERCEAAVSDTVRAMRGTDAQQVSFNRAKRTVAPPANDETDVKGEGSYRGDGGGRTFSFSCAYNTKTGTTSGVVFRDLGGPARGSDAASDKPWQPDLSTLAPEACESAVVAVIKNKYPRVGRIAFGSDSRKLKPAPSGRTGLEGQGGVERAVGMNLVPFEYRCEYEARTGKVVSARTNL